MEACEVRGVRCGFVAWNAETLRLGPVRRHAGSWLQPVAVSFQWRTARTWDSNFGCILPLEAGRAIPGPPAPGRALRPPLPSSVPVDTSVTIVVSSPSTMSVTCGGGGVRVGGDGCVDGALTLQTATGSHLA
jgi:hypothetical protein